MLKNQYNQPRNSMDNWYEDYDSWNDGYDSWNTYSNQGYSNEMIYPMPENNYAMKQQEEEIPNTWNLKPQTMKKIHRILIVLCVLLVLDAIWLVIELFRSGILG